MTSALQTSFARQSIGPRDAQTGMHEIVARKLELFVEFGAAERVALSKLFRGKARHVGARRPVACLGDPAGTIMTVLHGWVCPYKHLADGRWQILPFYTPGDLCDFGLQSEVYGDYSLRAVGDAIVFEVSRERLQETVAAFPRIAEAVRRADGVQAEILREWVLSLGQRSALERCAHLICELFWRLRAVGIAQGSVIDFPVTQEEIGGTIGVSTVHANRVLQDLRNARLIEQNGKRLKILDLKRLESLALFNPYFLHLGTDRPVRTEAPAEVRRGPVARHGSQPLPARPPTPSVSAILI